MQGTGYEELEALLARVLPGLGYELVDCELAGGGLLRIFIDHPFVVPLAGMDTAGRLSAQGSATKRGGAGSAITVEDCARVSEHLTHLFVVENIDYQRLEISSPGIDRPLTRAEDFIRFAGQRVRVRLRIPLEGRRKLDGTLLGLRGGEDVDARVPGGQLALRIDDGSTEGTQAGGSGRRQGKSRSGMESEVLLPWEQVERVNLLPEF